jgi:hypothetical protein
MPGEYSWRETGAVAIRREASTKYDPSWPGKGFLPHCTYRVLTSRVYLYRMQSVLVTLPRLNCTQVETRLLSSKKLMKAVLKENARLING